MELSVDRAVFEEFALACWERSLRAAPALGAEWAGAWARLGAGMEELAAKLPWAGMAPLGALAQADPDFLDCSQQALAQSVAFGAALEPQSSNPLWNQAFLEACALCWPRQGPSEGPALRRFERLCQESRPSRPRALAHDPGLSFADELAHALLRSAHPEALLTAAEKALGQDFWTPQSLEGFHRDFQASFAERLACHMLARGLDPDDSPARRSLALSRLAKGWSWLLERGELSPRRCADCVSDKANLAEMAWKRPGREGGPAAWRQACQAAWGDARSREFAEHLRAAGAGAAADALGPTPQEVERAQISQAIDHAPAPAARGRL